MRQAAKAAEKARKARAAAKSSPAPVRPRPPPCRRAVARPPNAGFHIPADVAGVLQDREPSEADPPAAAVRLLAEGEVLEEDGGVAGLDSEEMLGEPPGGGGLVSDWRRLTVPDESAADGTRSGRLTHAIQ